MTRSSSIALLPRCRLKLGNLFQSDGSQFGGLIAGTAVLMVSIACLSICSASAFDKIPFFARAAKATWTASKAAIADAPLCKSHSPRLDRSCYLFTVQVRILHIMISTPGKLSRAAAGLFCKTETNAPGVCFRAIIWPQARLLAGARQGRSAATCSRSPHRGRNRTLRDSMSVPQLVFLPRAVIAGNAAIFSPRWTMKAS
jgi:hypothetical protein